MQLVCDQCHATYELDPPAAPFARDQNLVFRCTACGHSIPIPRGEPEAVASVVDVPERPVPAQQGFLLRQEGKLYQVDDLAMLQRWIAERRIWRTDDISRDGAVWEKASDLEGVAVFFDLVEQAEKSTQPAPASGKGLFSKPKNTGDALASIQMPDGGLSAEIEPAPDEPLATVTEAFTEAFDVADEDASAAVSKVVAEEFDVMESVEAESVEEAEETAPLRLAVEAIPEEEPAVLPSVDEPTMDLGEDDFFSEEQSLGFDTPVMGSGGGDYDDELEWMQTKRKSMVTWWLLFFGALGGAGYFALDFLNQQDSKVPSSEAVTSDDPVEPAPADPVVTEAEKSDSGSTAEPDQMGDDVAAEEKGETEASVPVPETAAEPPPPPTPVTSTPTPTPAPPPQAAVSTPPPPPPTRANPGREVDRGWAKIDREAWDAARTHFNNALRADPASGDAKFGLAYVNENQGRTDEAVRQYCRLQTSGSGEAKAEAAGRLRALGRSCP